MSMPASTRPFIALARVRHFNLPMDKLNDRYFMYHLSSTGFCSLATTYVYAEKAPAYHVCIDIAAPSLADLYILSEPIKARTIVGFTVGLISLLLCISR